MKRILGLGLSLFVAATAVGYSSINPPSPHPAIESQLQDFESWLNLQLWVTEEKMYNNISPANTVRGTILASPSKADPNYYYYWVRDGALVMRSVLMLRESSSGADRQRHDDALMDYVRFSRANQIATGFEAMGEPRFNVDGSINTEPWGRPQNDGPALRALILTRYARLLIREGKKEFVTKELYDSRLPSESVIKADLEFTAHHWRLKCIDIWEEIWGHHFFTRASQLAALREGAALAEDLGDSGASAFYRKEANALEIEMQKHWSNDRGYHLATVDSNAGPDHQKPTELDTAVLLGALAAEQDSGILSIVDGKMLSTALKIEEGFAIFYGVNKDKRVGTAIGRYTEDYYFGGNPWFLTTAAFAELNYKIAAKIKVAKEFRIDSLQAPYFVNALKALSDLKIEPGVDLAADAIKDRVVKALVATGDSFMDRIRAHTGADGALSEQFQRDTGALISAHDLTWSYASFIRATTARSAL